MVLSRIDCTIPSAYARFNFKIRNLIECMVATSTQYNQDYYFCKVMALKHSETEFSIYASHLASKIIRTIKNNFPYITIEVYKYQDWK